MALKLDQFYRTAQEKKSCEELNRGANTAPDARLDIVARGIWERQRLAFLDVRIATKCRLLQGYESKPDLQAT